MNYISDRYITNHELNEINSVPIVREYSNFVLTDDEIKFVSNSEDMTYINRKRTNGLSSNKFLLENSRLKRVKDFINDRMMNYIDNVVQVSNKFELTQSWSTISKKGQYHHYHDHPNSIFSVIYYAQCESGDIQFYLKPRVKDGFNFSFKVEEWNNFNCGCWMYPVRTGDLMIFPAWIHHDTKPNENDTDRIIIGANYFIKGKVGEYDKTDLIEIYNYENIHSR